jgi:hypothetical protein
MSDSLAAIEDRRKAQRQRVLKAGSIVLDRGGTIDCQVRNLSDSGALLRVETTFGIPDHFTLKIPQDSGTHVAVVKWRRAMSVGVVFERPTK